VDQKIIQPLNLADFEISEDTSNPGFTELFNSQVGDAASPLDGFDDLITEVTGLIDSLDSGLAALGGAEGGDLDDTFAEILTLDPEPVAQTLADVTAAMPAIDAAANELGDILAPFAPPTPPGGGGGGGGSGGGPPAAVVANIALSMALSEGRHTFLLMSIPEGSPAAITGAVVSQQDARAIFEAHAQNVLDPHTGKYVSSAVLTAAPRELATYVCIVNVTINTGGMSAIVMLLPGGGTLTYPVGQVDQTTFGLRVTLGVA
jgi:hypothetical protein